MSSKKYRRSVAAVIVNCSGKIFVGKPPSSETMGDINWQLPQGGIDEGETVQEALFREIGEELGIQSDLLKIIKKSNRKYQYNWPPEVVERRGLFGQKQTYFLLRYNGSDKDIKLDKKEFASWKWVSAEEVAELQKGGLRENIYPEVLKEFELI